MQCIAFCLQEEVMTLERILLQTIKFDLQVEHPYGYLLKYAKCLKGETHICFFRHKASNLQGLACVSSGKARRLQVPLFHVTCCNLGTCRFLHMDYSVLLVDRQVPVFQGKLLCPSSGSRCLVLKREAAYSSKMFVPVYQTM